MIPLVLLPGMMCDARLFAPQIAALSARRSITVAALTERDSISGLAEAVLAEAPPKFAVAGLSMGGIVAMEVLHQAPERVAGVALLDTNPLAERPELAEARAAQIEAVQAGRLTEVMRGELVPRYAACPDDRLVALCLDMAAALGPEVFVRQSKALRDRADRTETLGASRCPALILVGAEDRMCPPDRHYLMKQLMPHARLEILPGAGHLTTLERPDDVTAALNEWLETR